MNTLLDGSRNEVLHDAHVRDWREHLRQRPAGRPAPKFHTVAALPVTRASNAIEPFRDAIRAAGLPPPNVIVDDGELHRFPTNAKRGDDSGWYVLYGDGVPAGAFGDWRTGVKGTWRGDFGRNLTPAEREKQRAHIEAAQRARDVDETKRHENVSEQAARIWKASKETPSPDHQYAQRKGINPTGARLYKGTLEISGMKCDGALVLRLIGVDGKTWNLQFIAPNGEKRFLPGGRTRGPYFGVSGDADRPLVIAEGYATAISIHKATGMSVLAALSLSNLQQVATAIRAKFPDRKIIIAADDDYRTAGNPGITKAMETAGVVGALVAVPDFGADRPEGGTDFNDLFLRQGADAVRRALEAAREPDRRWQLEIRSATACDSDRLPAASFDSNGSTSDWPEPKPILAELKPVMPFDADALLPQELRQWIIDEAERMPCPPDFVAVAAVTALGSISGARSAIKPTSRDSWLIVPNLWGGIVGDPSAKKSPAWGVALRPLDRLVAKAHEAYTLSLAEYETSKVVFDAQKEAIKGRIKDAASRRKSNKAEPTNSANLTNIDDIAKELRAHNERGPAPPTLRRYKTNDSTVEKLGELLRENPAGLLVLRDELVGLIASWEREGREGDRAFFLESWNGNQSFDTDRIGRGHISIPNVCLSIFGGIQPDKLVVYLEQASNALANDGMLQRFQLLVYPDSRRWEWRNRVPDKAARDAAFAVFEKLAEFDPVAAGASPADDFTKFPHFHFDDEAQKLFIEWSSELHQERIPSEPDPIICQHLAKYDKLFPALALIFHLVDFAANGVYGPVSTDAAMRAAAWCEYLESHARRCYGLLKDDGLRAAQALAAKLEHGELDDGFTHRDIRRHQWRNLTTDDAVQAALDWLEDEGWLRSESTGGTGPGSGRRTTRYRINPAIIARYKEKAA